MHAAQLRPARSRFNVGDWVECRMLSPEGHLEIEWTTTRVEEVLDDGAYAVGCRRQRG